MFDEVALVLRAVLFDPSKSDFAPTLPILPYSLVLLLLMLARLLQDPEAAHHRRPSQRIEIIIKAPDTGT